jgi:hypothetical protein
MRGFFVAACGACMSADAQDTMVAAMKAAPPVAVTSAHWLFGLTLNDWVAIFTIVYVLLQTALLIYNFLCGWWAYCS